MNNSKTNYLPMVPKTAVPKTTVPKTAVPKTAAGFVVNSVILEGDATITDSRYVRSLEVIIDTHPDFKK